MVLLAQRVTEGHAHADVFVGLNDRVRLLLGLARIAGEPTVQMLRGRCAGGQHLERGVKGIVVGNAVAHRDAGRKPQFKRRVGYAELDRREPDMVMGVDEARQRRLFAVAYDRRAGIGGAQLRKRAYRDDDSIPLQHSAVIDLLPPMAIKRARNDMLAAHDRN